MRSVCVMNYLLVQLSQMKMVWKYVNLDHQHKCRVNLKTVNPLLPLPSSGPWLWNALLSLRSPPHSTKWVSVLLSRQLKNFVGMKLNHFELPFWEEKPGWNHTNILISRSCRHEFHPIFEVKSKILNRQGIVPRPLHERRKSQCKLVYLKQFLRSSVKDDYD